MQVAQLTSTAATSSGATAPAGFPASLESTGANSTRYHGRRRLVQAISFALAVLVPASGLFRIDPSAGALVVLDRQIWFSDFFLVAGVVDHAGERAGDPVFRSPARYFAAGCARKTSWPNGPIS